MSAKYISRYLNTELLIFALFFSSDWAVGNILYELGRSPVTCSSISIAYSTSALTLLLLLIQLIRDLA